MAGALHWQGTATCQEQDLAQVGSRHCYLARTKTSWWQAKYLAGRNRTWFMLVAGTVLGKNRGLVHVGGSHYYLAATWLMLVAGTILCWWKAALLGSSKESIFSKKISVAVLKYTVFQNKSIISFVPVSLNSIRRTSFKAQSTMSKSRRNQHVRVKAQSKKQNQKTKFCTGQSESHRRHSSHLSSSETAWTEESKSLDDKCQ